jgi:hypothetical protein
LPHCCDEEKDLSHQDRTEPFRITNKALHWISKLKTSPPATLIEITTIEKLIYDLKAMYMMDMGSLWHQNGKVHRAARNLEGGESEGGHPSENLIRSRINFPKYFELEFMRRWSWIPRLIPCLISAAALDLKDFEEEIGLDRSIRSIMDEPALVTITRTSRQRAMPSRKAHDLASLSW